MEKRAAEQEAKKRAQREAREQAQRKADELPHSDEWPKNEQAKKQALLEAKKRAEREAQEKVGGSDSSDRRLNEDLAKKEAARKYAAR